MFFVLAFSDGAAAAWYSDVRDKMGTRVEVQLWSDDEIAAQALIRDAMAEFDRIEAAMSTYRESSEISAVNAHAADRPVVVSAELFGLVSRALELSARTGGAFDITYDSVGRLYDYRRGLRPRQAQIDADLPKIGYRHVQLDAETLSVRFALPGVRINLGGIAKGYAVEAVIARLKASGVEHALATAGGDSRLLGDRGDQPWIVGIRNPDDEDGLVTRLALIDEAISTSGDYERFFVENGVRYHHILNPQTGASATGVRSVTVIGPDATMTDGLSTSVFVLGTEAGLSLIESLPGYECVVVEAGRRMRFSSGLDTGAAAVTDSP